MSSIISNVEVPDLNTSLQRDTSETTTTYSSYKLYIEQNVQLWPQYRWLQAFFNHRGGGPESTKTVVYDSVGGTLVENNFPVSDPMRFRNFVRSRPSGVATRMIILEYKETWSVDSTFIDIVASLFNIDPIDLQTHLHHDGWRAEYMPRHLRDMLEKLRLDYDINESPMISIPPSEEAASMKVLHFDMGYGGRTSVFFMGNPREDNSSVLILIRDTDCFPSFGRVQRLDYNNENRLPPIYNQESSMYSRIDASIQLMSAADIQECDGGPHLFSYHVFRAWLLSRLNEMHSASVPKHPDQVDDETLGWELLDLVSQRAHSHSLRYLLEGQYRAESKYLGPSKALNVATRMKGLVADLDLLCQKIDSAIAENHRSRNRLLADTQLEEAQQSRSTAMGVASLTKVATMYIPLSFTASFYGMNMAEFGNGTGRLWLFLVSALVCGVITAIPFRTQGLTWIKGFPTVKENPWAITWRMTWYFPVQGFWLAMYTLSHPMRMVHKLYEDGLYSFKKKVGKKGTMRYLDDKNFHDKFWRNRLKKVFEVVDHPDWGKRSFIRRVWMKYFTKPGSSPTAHA